MKSLLTKVISTAAAAVVLFVGCMMAGLGLTVIAFLAMFGLAAIGLALLAAPFMAVPKQDSEDAEFEMVRETPAAG